MDVAPNGDIYVVQNEQNSTVYQEINVWRSTDAGATFHLWGSLSDADTVYWADDVKIVDGAEPLFMMIYRYDDGDTNTQIRLVRCPLAATADFSSQIIVMADPDVRFHSGAFDTDVSTFEEFYVYVVASGALSPGQDIWFARSTNQGDSFETPYMIAELTVPDRYYASPDISYGYGGHLHAVWCLNIDDDSGYDSSLRYRHASSFGGGGLSSWDYWVSMTSGLDGVDDRYPVIHGGRQSHDVFIAYSRWVIPGSFAAACFVSDDDGSTFGSPTALGTSVRRLGDVAEDPGYGPVDPRPEHRHRLRLLHRSRLRPERLVGPPVLQRHPLPFRRRKRPCPGSDPRQPAGHDLVRSRQRRR